MKAKYIPYGSIVKYPNGNATYRLGLKLICLENGQSYPIGSETELMLLDKLASQAEQMEMIRNRHLHEFSPTENREAMGIIKTLEKLEGKTKEFQTLMHGTNFKLCQNGAILIKIPRTYGFNGLDFMGKVYDIESKALVYPVEK